MSTLVRRAVRVRTKHGIVTQNRMVRAGEQTALARLSKAKQQGAVQGAPDARHVHEVFKYNETGDSHIDRGAKRGAALALAAIAKVHRIGGTHKFDIEGDEFSGGRYSPGRGEGGRAGAHGTVFVAATARHHGVDALQGIGAALWHHSFSDITRPGSHFRSERHEAHQDAAGIIAALEKHHGYRDANSPGHTPAAFGAAYAHYVAERSGNRGMLRAIAEEARPRDSHFMRVGSPEAKEMHERFDTLFRGRGWAV